MIALLTDARFDSLANASVGLLTIVPAILSAFLAKGARKSSREANVNADEARANSADALHEVKANMAECRNQTQP